MLKSVVAFLISLLFTLILPLGGNAQNHHQEEIKGVWLTNIDSEVLFSARHTTETINTLTDFGFNRLYPTVWNGGYTLYPSQVLQKVTGINIDPEERLTNRDVLEEIVQQAKGKEIKVIPWFEFGFMAPSESILSTKYPHWLTNRLDGDKIWLEGGVIPRTWLNPLHPEVQEFITDLVLEIVTNHDVDGIQFDDHFGYPSDFGYDPYTVSLYRQEHNGMLPPPNHLNKEWGRWRADKITAFFASLQQKVKNVNPNLIISVSPNPQEFSLEQYLLDWAKWDQLNLIDELIVQLYRDNMIAFQREMAQPDLQKAKNHIPTAIGILSGLKGRPMPLDMIKQQVEGAVKNGYSGVAFFFYESLWNFGPESIPERQEYFSSIFRH
ncbi:MAG: family 10 glycosylhydrolase [Cyanobacterium sp. T60_A2020_053]|nr:family 10 glycosylhydrolase [Cyanobacterium sp. T60_A2020_053]